MSVARIGNGLFARTGQRGKTPARTDFLAPIAPAPKPSQSDRERALLICADEGRTMHAEPQDVVALLAFMEDEETGL